MAAARFPTRFPPCPPIRRHCFGFRCSSRLSEEEEYLVDAPVLIGDGFSFSGGKYAAGKYAEVSSRFDEWFSQGKMDDESELFFRINRSTPLKKLMNAYCDRQSVDINHFAFLFDGSRLSGEQTPEELEMEDGDEIDAMLPQIGGSTINYCS